MSFEPIELSLLIEAEQLLPLLHHPQLRIVDLSRPAVYEQVHLPNALALKPNMMVRQEENASGLLPNVDQLASLVKTLAISPEHHVVVYDDEGGAWAGRLIWTLHSLGFNQVSLLNGGIHTWLARGFPTSLDAFEANEGSSELITSESISINTRYQIQREEIQQGLAAAEMPFNLWDCRTIEEYTGARLAARRGGHIPSAFHLEWSTALDRQDNLRLRPLAVIRQKLIEHGLDQTKPVVVYCQSHHRSGLTYVIARLLNLHVRAYDGAWSEWGNRLDTPIVTGEHHLEQQQLIH
jgi:thiosulfate/3-mercaptopyruvate sulfurtransferase